MPLRFNRPKVKLTSVKNSHWPDIMILKAEMILRGKNNTFQYGQLTLKGLLSSGKYLTLTCGYKHKL